jgi:hypothetical protein
VFSETDYKNWFLVLLAQNKVLWLRSGYDKEVSVPINGQGFEQLSDCHLKKTILCPYQWCQIDGINIDIADVTLCFFALIACLLVFTKRKTRC